MHYFIAAMLAVASVTAQPLGAQTPATAPRSAPGSIAVPPLTLTGCVGRGDGKDQFTLADEAKSGVYELTGADVRSYVGMRVQVQGESPNRLHVAGGLWPTSNAAAQAGAIDPGQAAIAALPGGGSRGTGPNPVLEFKVVPVRKLNGSCE